MFVDKIHPIIGRGVVAVGRIEKGQVKIGDPVEIAGLTTEVRKTVVAGIETFRKSLNAGKAGDYVGLLLRGFGSNDVGRGQAIASPGSLSVHSAFQAELYALAKEEGGRHTPFFTGYKPQFYFRTADVPGVITLPPGQEKCRPGDNMAVTVRLPENRPLPIVAGQRFAVRDGGFTVAVGAATGVLR
jgi:elongation factor Tu